ncbi:MFS transporter [Massilia atriviolacea]|uniref:MFS transporter n=1 Tax=Massilia atriviolacea TaxID=2495579 RepID=A0A430HTK0_9BURK|nr:MFS transporter [Massilia atriviolacea]RSZ60847.1 MFS transporter [Massilia atriviolacea]
MAAFVGERRAMLAALAMSMLLSSLGTSIANVGLPTLAQAFGATFAQVQWIVLAYLLAVTTLIVGVGRLGDIAGRRRLLLAGIALFAAASILCAAAPTLAWLIAARALQGLGAAAMMGLTMSFAAGAASAGGTGSVMGLLGTMSAVGTALGPTLGGLLIGAAGWRALFLVTAPLAIAAWLLAYRALPADMARADGERMAFDGVGTVLLASTLGAYALAMTAGGNLVLLGGAAVGAWLFVLAARRADSPLIPLALLRDRLLGARLATTALVSTVMMATLVVGPFYLSRALALEPAAVGLVLSSGPLVAALSGVPAGRLVDCAGTARVTIAGLGLMLAGAVPLALLSPAAGVPGYLVPMAVITIGYALFQAANNTALMDAAGADRRGLVSSMLNLARNLGLVSGASLMGAVFAYGGATVTVGMHRTFALAALLLAAALLIAVSAEKGREQQT